MPELRLLIKSVLAFNLIGITYQAVIVVKNR